jgi:tetratricopeptide (TPR) repeat protein
MATHVFICAVLALPAGADDPAKKLTAEERKELEAKWQELTDAGNKAYQAGKSPDAITSFKESLKVARRLYNVSEFPDGHANLALSLNNLGGLYLILGKLDSVEPLVKEALEMYRRLYKGEDDSEIALSLNNLASLYQHQGQLSDAEPLFKESLEMRKRLFKGQDDPDLALGLNNLAALYRDQGKLGAAEPLYNDALEMLERLLEGQDHPNLAKSLNNLATLYKNQGKLVDAEPLFKESLEMRKRLFKGQDHPDLARSLNNLASLYEDQGKLGDAEQLFKDAVEMWKRLFKDQDHPDLANCLNNLAALYLAQGKLVAAEPLFKESLEMRKRLFKGQDHPDLAISLHNLAMLYKEQGKLGDAEQLFKDALEMQKRLFKDQDHPDLALGLNKLATLYQAQGKRGAAELLSKDALEMFRRLAVAFARDRTEEETLTLLARQPLTRDAYLSTAQGHAVDSTATYSQVWADKGYIARAYERRLLQARARHTGPKAVRVLADLTDVRRRRDELLRAPAISDPTTLLHRKQDIATYEDRIEKMTRDLKVLLPASVRADTLAAAPSDLQKALPADAAVVDFLRFVHFEPDENKPGKAGEARTPRYLAFVVTKEKVAWVDLDTAKKIEPAVNAWRRAIAGDPVMKLRPAATEMATELGRKVRELIWEKVRKELPAVIKTVYVCPDATLCQMPFPALPGDRPGTILLEDFAVAMIPHAPFLLDKLWPQDPIKNPPTNALVVGGVTYDATPSASSPDAATRRSDPLLNPDAKPSWSFLGNTVGEANGVAASAVGRNLPVVRFDGDKATTEALLKALPKAKYAHFATRASAYLTVDFHRVCGVRSPKTTPISTYPSP